MLAKNVLVNAEASGSASSPSKKGEDQCKLIENNKNKSNLFVKSTELIENVPKTLYTKENIPKLHERWIPKIADLMGPLPEQLPPLREVNHHIPLIDKSKVVRTRYAKCPDHLQTQLIDKVKKYC